jgi:maltooligosyltrehalose trehalohydrolase
MVRKGRSEEFKDFYDDNQDAPDPSSEETFNKSRLSWNIKEDEEKAAMFAFYKSLINLRKENPVLSTTDKDRLTIDEKEKCFTLIRWQNDNTIVCLMNFSEKEANIRIPSSIKGTLDLIIDSAEEKYKGYGSQMKRTVGSGDEMVVPAKTFSIYSN